MVPRKHLFGCRGGEVLFSRNVKLGMLGLGIAPQEIFLAYSTQFVFFTIRLVPGNVVMVAIDMCGKNAITREWIYGITCKHVYFNIFVFFIVDTTLILKLVFPAAYCFCLDGHLGGWLCCCHYCYCCYLLIN